MDGRPPKPTGRLKEIMDQESRHSWPKIGLLCVSFVGVGILDVTKELSDCGSQAYYFSAFLTIPYVLLFFFTYRSYLMRMQAEKVSLGFEFLDGDVHWDARSTVVYPILCIFAGFFAGMFGVGGGIIKGPLMLEMGILPVVASANASAMILFTTGIACLSFFLFGAMDAKTGSILFVLGLVCTGVGQYFLGIAIKRANRQSLVILSMGFVVVFSAILLTLRSIVDGATREGGFNALMQMGSLCGGEEEMPAPLHGPHGGARGFASGFASPPRAAVPAPAPLTGHGHFVYDDE